ncbi:MAG: alpha/beta fold hydrolase [Rubricella sp.]
MPGAAPLLTDIASFPQGGEACFLSPDTGVEIRAARWADGARGTVFVLPGRTEYVEKYDLTIGWLIGLGYSVVCVDWRGQGLSTRAGGTKLGHVKRYAEFQRDLDAVLDWCADLPAPRYALCHSMGGLIGLRALIRGLPFERAAFCGPMWGLNLRPVQHVLGPFAMRFLAAIGRGMAEAPGARRTDPAAQKLFEINPLTTDPDRFRSNRAQVERHPELSLGPPSVGWLTASFDEMTAVADAPAPETPALVFVGTDERVVSQGAIMTQGERMAEATVIRMEGGRHELLQERPAIRDAIRARIEGFFA